MFYTNLFFLSFPFQCLDFFVVFLFFLRKNRSLSFICNVCVLNAGPFWLQLCESQLVKLKGNENRDNKSNFKSQTVIICVVIVECKKAAAYLSNAPTFEIIHQSIYNFDPNPTWTYILSSTLSGTIYREHI
jgi:hypothetical protein